MKRLQTVLKAAQTLRKSKLLGDLGLAAIAFVVATIADQSIEAIQITQELAYIFAGAVFAISASTDLMPAEHHD